MKTLQKSKLHTTTQRLLKTRPANLTYDQISKDTGLTTSWLRAFGANQLDDPTASRLETLYEYLAKKPLIPE